MRLLSRRSILFVLLILSFSLLNAQGMPGGGAPGGNPPSGQPPAGTEPPKNLPPPPQHPKDPENIIKYRGSRTYSENLPLKIIQTKCTRKDGNMVFVEIMFNQCINPRSIKPESILINNAPLPPFIRFLFNRKGTTVKMIIPLTLSSFKMKVCNICSFDNTIIEPVEFLVEVER